MIEGERKLVTSHGYLVLFDEGSIISIGKETPGGFMEVLLDPTDLSVIYHAYTGMVKELAEKKKIEEASK